MRSTVTRYYDYRSEPVPEEIRRWRVNDEEIQEQLAALSRAYAEETVVETVEAGDAVRCVCVGGSVLPDRESVLLYPGRSLPGVEKAEDAVLGRNIGESFDATIGSHVLKLRVEEIRRRCPAEINDGLIRLAGIDGVETIEDFACWYRKNNEPERKRVAMGNIASYWMQVTEKRSELLIDAEERMDWAMRHARRDFDSLAAGGLDLCIPGEDDSFLAAEQIIQQMAERIAPNFDLVVTVRYMANRRDIVLDEVYLERRYQEIAVAQNISLEQTKADDDPESILEHDYMDRLYDLLAAEAEPFLEV